MSFKPNIKVKVEDDGDTYLYPTKESAGVSGDGLLVFDDHNKLAAELRDYGCVERSILEALAAIKSGDKEVRV
jgi:hypothetical protein